MLGFEEVLEWAHLHELANSFPDTDVLLADDMVQAYIAGTFAGRCIIYKWCSLCEGMGYATRALKELRTYFTEIVVDDACNDTYWNLMLERGLIDRTQ